MTIPYTYHPKIVMRTPQKPLSISIGQETDFLQWLVKDENFLEALFLASPILHTELLKYKEGNITDGKAIKKLVFSLSKYHLRMGSRCTPFGLFSGCSVLQWSQGQTDIVIDSEKQLDRHTRFDMHYLCALAQHLATLSQIKTRLVFYPNTALYAMADEIRYVEYHYQNGHRKHIISAILASEYANNILAASQTGITVAQMIAMLICDEITEDEATTFINEMIEAQVLVSELEPAVTGNEFLFQIIDTLKKINAPEDAAITAVINALLHIDQLINNIDANNTNDHAAYQQIIDCLQQFTIPFEANKLFQTDLNFNLKRDKVNAGLQAEITEALSLINQLNKRQDNSNLQSFAKRFYERYEDAELPLLEVLDNETGIGYIEQAGGNITPLLDEMAIDDNAAAESQFAWAAKDKFLFNKLLQAHAMGSYQVEFDATEFAEFKNSWDHLPPSISVMFRLVDDKRIFLESGGSSSAINLLSRFAHGNKAIGQIIEDVVKEEDEKNPSIIFAEIVHLPESRIGNILLHPVFRKYEIPFLSKSSVAAPNQIALQDLMISVSGNTILLRSKKLNKIIVPRLSSAHNYSYGALPIYQFLADMQLQGKQGGIHFKWGIMDTQFSFLPRAVYKNVIISAAQWNFTKKDIETFNGKKEDELTAAISQFKEKWKLPKLIVLADSDNELLVNFEDKLLVNVWLDAIKNRNSFVVKEFLNSIENASVKDGNGKSYVNQFIGILIRNTPAYNMPALVPNNGTQISIHQNFPIGTEWVYYKMYCGYKTADTILQVAIQPLIKVLMQEKAIDSFFFIRYSDPNFHIRLRLHISDTSKVGYVLNCVLGYTKQFLQQRLIWNIQNDTYKRELNRYGHQAIEHAEKLFYYDSVAVLQFLEYTEGDSRENLRWKWVLRSIDEWLNVFDYTLQQKFALMEQVKNSFHTEFKSDRFLKEQLGSKYRKQKAAIENIMDYKMSEENELFPLIQILKEKSIAIKPIVLQLQQMEEQQKLMPAINQLMPSYIHMLVNRIVTSSPRQHELVLYDLLYCYYKSDIARTKASPKEKANARSLELVEN